MEKTMRLLLVDDEEETRRIYAEFLREGGFEVVEASNGLEGFEIINAKAPDIILTGIIMPKMDGFTLVENLRKNMATASIPIVFLSHLGRKEDEERAAELKVNDFIVRDTTSPREVIARLRALLSSTQYILGIESTSYDGQKFAREMGLHPEFLCSTGQGQRYVLRVKQKHSSEKHFDAELICV